MQNTTTTRTARIRSNRANSAAVTVCRKSILQNGKLTISSKPLLAFQPRSSSLKAVFFSAERSRPSFVSVGIKPECRSNPKRTEDVAVEGYFDGKVPLSYSVQEFPPGFPIPLPYELVLFFVKSVRIGSIKRLALSQKLRGNKESANASWTFRRAVASGSATL